MITTHHISYSSCAYQPSRPDPVHVPEAGATVWLFWVAMLALVTLKRILK